MITTIIEMSDNEWTNTDSNRATVVDLSITAENKYCCVLLGLTYRPRDAVAEDQ